MASTRIPRRWAGIDLKIPAELTGCVDDLGPLALRIDPHLPGPLLHYAALSSSALVPARSQDRWQVAPQAGLLVIADGVSGYAAGDVASELAVQTACQLVPRLLAHGLAPLDALARAVAACNDQIRDFAVNRPGCAGMATTLVCALIGSNLVHLAHVGDSRAYLMRDGKLRRLTVDHSIGQQIIASGRLSEAQVNRLPSRGILTRAVGVAERVAPDLASHGWHRDDTLMLCSDGLTAALTDPVIEYLMVRSDRDGPAVQVRELVSGAIQTGVLRDVTAVVAVSVDYRGLAHRDGKSAAGGPELPDRHGEQPH